MFSQRVRWRPWYLALVLFPPRLVLRRHLPARPLPLGRRSGGAVPQPGDPLDQLGLLPLPRRVGVERGHAACRGVRALGAAPPRLSVSPRARERGRPWGYYLDILLALAVGAGILLLVLDDLRRGLSALSALSGDLQRAGREQDVLAALLARPLTLPAVRGSALYTAR